jgi:tetratricopeptide (TPR) repeat protein
MKALAKCLIALAIMGSANVVQGKTLEGYIKKAKDYQNSGKLEQAEKIMEKAVKEYPGSSNAYAYSGLYTGMQAGETNNFIKAGMLVSESFKKLDRAVSLDSLNPLARLYRGLMGVNVPEFLGKLERGIKDLEFVVKMHKQYPERVSMDILVSTYNFLGKGYQKNGEKEKAKLAWGKVIELAPGTNLAESAEENIKKLSPSETKEPQPPREKERKSAAVTQLKEKVQKEPDNPALLIDLGKAYIDTMNYEEAEKVLRRAISIDSSNVEAYKWLASALVRIAAKGYDERIAEDTNFRTNLVFESVELLDKAVALAPEDIDLRLSRGVAEVNVPFFVGKLGQGIDDLNKVLKSDAPDSIKAEALYWLGLAYQKKGMSYWTEVVTKYPEYKAAQMVFEGMQPKVKRFESSKHRTPIVVIDFVLGFRDELAPQTAVWIEDKNGEFIKTIYVSGFSGYAKEKQVNLPKWANSSKFVDVDAVTGASIDLGHHIYVWDLRDSSGRRVKSGKYTVKVEVSYWPSMKYQLVSAPIQLGRREKRVVVKEGNFIPYLEVKYFSKEGK